MQGRLPRKITRRKFLNTASKCAKKDLFFLCPCHGAEFDKQGNAVRDVMKKEPGDIQRRFLLS